MNDVGTSKQMQPAVVACWWSCCVLAALLGSGVTATADEAGYPRFQIDAAWPAVLPNNYLLGNVGGLTVDARDHVWILSRPRTLQKSGMLGLAEELPTAECCLAAPPVVELDTDGRYVRGWGGPNAAAGYEWPENEHGITVDHAGHVWICGNGPNDHQCLKFTRTGQFLLQIGKAAQSKGSRDTRNLNQATQVQVWPDTNEVFIADGYMNRRVIVFDAATGAFKRMWGAYGNVPDDDAPTAQIFTGPGPR